MRLTRLLYVPFLVFTFSSCFEKDKPMPLVDWNGQTFAFDQSIYTNQFFFNLETNTIVKNNPDEDWDLSFEASSKGWHIRVNSSSFLNIYNTNTTDFSGSQFQLNEKNWKYDKSNGDIDSTAIGTWVDISQQPYVYSGHIYLIGRFDGVFYKPVKKLKFTSVDDTSYRFIYADMDGKNAKEGIVIKDTVCNYSYFSLSTGQQVKIEPPGNDWDLLFTQYATTLYDNGNPVPYYVRGVLINPFQVRVAEDSSKVFENISLNDLSSFSFETDWDVIGYNWKSVVIDIQSNSAVYHIRKGYNYIIRDVKGNYYKLRFVSFYNKTGEAGFPTFDFLKL
jgi:hypothetical protein